MQQRYLLTPGGQRLYSAAKLDVEWEIFFLFFIIIYPRLRALLSYRFCLRGLWCLPPPVSKYYVLRLTHDTPAAASKKKKTKENYSGIFSYLHQVHNKV